MAAVQVSGGVAHTPWGPVPIDAADGEHTALIRPSGMVLDPAGAVNATVTARTFRGDSVALLLEPRHGPQLEASCRLAEAPSPGADVQLRIDPAEVVLLP